MNAGQTLELALGYYQLATQRNQNNRDAIEEQKTSGPAAMMGDSLQTWNENFRLDVVFPAEAHRVITASKNLEIVSGRYKAVKRTPKTYVIVVKGNKLAVEAFAKTVEDNYRKHGITTGRKMKITKAANSCIFRVNDCTRAKLDMPSEKSLKAIRIVGIIAAICLADIGKLEEAMPLCGEIDAKTKWLK